MCTLPRCRSVESERRAARRGLHRHSRFTCGPRAVQSHRASTKEREFPIGLIQINHSRIMSKKQLSPWNSVVSGTTAAVLAGVLVYPLDLYGPFSKTLSVANSLKSENPLASAGAAPKGQSR